MNAPPPVPPNAQDNQDVRPLGQRVLINTGALTSSSLWRIGVSFLLQLLIARMLGVQALGVYTVALAFLNVGQVLSELGLPALLARDLATSPSQRRAYFYASLRIQIAAALLVWVGLVLLAILLPYAAATQWALILIGASLPLYAVTSAAETQFRAAERMELVMGVEMFINLTILLVSVVLLLGGAGVMALIGVLVATQAVSAIVCSIVLRQTHLLAPPQEAVDVGARQLWRHASAFFWLSVAEVLQQRLDILVLSIVAGPIVTGIYSAAYNLVRVVGKLIQSYWQALYPTLSRVYSEADRRYETLSSLSLHYGLLLLLPAAAITAGVAGGLINLIYTAEYHASAAVLRWLIWTTPLLFVMSYSVTQLLVRHYQQYSLGVIGANLLVLLVAMPLLVARWGATGAAWASVSAAAAGTAVGLAFLQSHKIRFEPGHAAWIVGAALAAGVLATFLPIFWPARVVVAACAYALLLWSVGGVSTEDVARFRNAIRLNTR